MATTFKDLNQNNDIVSTRTLLHESIPLTGTIASGTYGDNNIKNYPVHEIRHRGLERCVNETLERLSDVDMIYISFDVDSMDCDLISKGTGTPVSKGFDIDEVVAIIDRIMESKKVVSLEVTEVNPLLDNKGNRMAEAAFEVIQRLFQKK